MDNCKQIKPVVIEPLVENIDRAIAENTEVNNCIESSDDEIPELVYAPEISESNQQLANNCFKDRKSDNTIREQPVTKDATEPIFSRPIFKAIQIAAPIKKANPINLEAKLRLIKKLKKCKKQSN